jgi:hypothetical protein
MFFGILSPLTVLANVPEAYNQIEGMTDASDGSN